MPPGFNQYCREFMCLALERTKHGDTCGDRTQDLSIRSPSVSWSNKMEQNELSQ